MRFKLYRLLIAIFILFILLGILISKSFFHGIFWEFFALMIYLICRFANSWESRKGIGDTVPALYTILCSIVLILSTFGYILTFAR